MASSLVHMLWFEVATVTTSSWGGFTATRPLDSDKADGPWAPLPMIVEYCWVHLLSLLRGGCALQKGKSAIAESPG